LDQRRKVNAPLSSCLYLTFKHVSQAWAVWVKRDCDAGTRRTRSSEIARFVELSRTGLRDPPLIEVAVKESKNVGLPSVVLAGNYIHFPQRRQKLEVSEASVVADADPV
jgi:hypothetical protein